MVCVLIRRLNSSCNRSIAFDVRIDFHWLFGKCVKVKSLSSASSRLSATAGHFSLTALHNHLLRVAPATFYMHILGRGDPVKLVAALHDDLFLSKTPLTASSGAAPPPIELDTALIDRTLGAKGKVNGGVYQVSLKRAATVNNAGMAVPEAMGTAEAINFQPTGDGNAAIAGDFVLTADEVNPVLRVLRDNGIEVTALHNHMLNYEPRLFFMHFWANDEVAKLAAGLKAALDKIDLARG